MDKDNNDVGFVPALEKVLDELSSGRIFVTQIKNTTIQYEGTLEDTANGKRQVFKIIRKVKW